MNRKLFSRPLPLLSLALLTTIACMTSASTTPTPIQSPPTQATTTQPTETEPALTETITPTSEGNPEVTLTAPGPACTILQGLNLRSGPGMAYRPPIRTLPANSTVTPLGFASKGIPSGSWAYVEDPATGDEGWVSAGPQYISCNVEFATLPSVAFNTPPPPPLPKSTQTSDPDGNGFCIDPNSEYKCVGVFSDKSLFQFQILKNGVEQGASDGVGPVTFTIKRGDDTVYSLVENSAAYCVFGGNGPCNNWIVEDWTYKWTSGGAPVEPGEYEMEVIATVNGESSRWAVIFTLALP